jgi:hypothetical protein
MRALAGRLWSTKKLRVFTWHHRGWGYDHGTSLDPVLGIANVSTTQHVDIISKYASYGCGRSPTFCCAKFAMFAVGTEHG